MFAGFELAISLLIKYAVIVELILAFSLIEVTTFATSVILPKLRVAVAEVILSVIIKLPKLVIFADPE